MTTRGEVYFVGAASLFMAANFTTTVILAIIKRLALQEAKNCVAAP
jgi:hypothetical protein